MNIFANADIANQYDAYYETENGKQVDAAEKATFEELIREIPRGTLLELGAGTGHWTRFFVEQGFDVMATDVSEAMFVHAKQKLAGQAKFLKADMQNLSFDHESFDVLAVITALEFVEDPFQAMANMYRVLKERGWLIVGALNAKSALAKNKDNDPVFKHATFLTKGDLEMYLEGFGEPIIKGCVYLNEQGELLDGTEAAESVEPLFFAAIVQKD